MRFGRALHGRCGLVWSFCRVRFALLGPTSDRTVHLGVSRARGLKVGSMNDGSVILFCQDDGNHMPCAFGHFPQVNCHLMGSEGGFRHDLSFPPIVETCVGVEVFGFHDRCVVGVIQADRSYLGCLLSRRSIHTTLV